MVLGKPEVLQYSFPRLCKLVEHAPEQTVLDAIDELHAFELTDLGKRRMLAQQFPFRQTNGRIKQNLAFHAAARKQEIGGSYRILQKLRDIGMPLNTIDYFNQTPLFFAAREYDLDSIRLLVKARCDVAQMDHNKHTCIYYASRVPPSAERDKTGKKNTSDNTKRRIATTKLLVQFGCRADIRDTSGNMVAEYCGNIAELRGLLQINLTKRKRTKRPLPTTDRQWLHEFVAPGRDGKGNVKYGIRYAEVGDATYLGHLEDEFIKDHQDLLGNLFGECPPSHTTCLSLGVNVHANSRRNIISAIASKTDKYARTIVAVDKETGELAGYLYFKCKSSRDEKTVEISHLKVKGTHRRRGVGKSLFVAVTQHMKTNAMTEFGQHMGLSVYDANAAAIGMYEAIGFEQVGEAWRTPMKEWEGKEEDTPQIWWRRYARHQCLEMAKKPTASENSRERALRRRLS
eukprot:GEMP01019241.1.p1 GENE.GEMP01019241.1~~GEMP01019241.1.p1  ORF type:complete len:458 (+),score=93.68 GEMP01019241.1:644-2017(+)